LPKSQLVVSAAKLEKKKEEISAWTREIVLLMIVQRMKMDDFIFILATAGNTYWLIGCIGI